MKKKSTLKIFAAVFCIASSHAFSRTIVVPKLNEKTIGSKYKTPPSSYDLDPLIVVSQNVNQKGLVVVEGKLTKPFMTDNVKLSIKYQDSQGNWVIGWSKMLYSYNQYNESLKATLELPASAVSSYNLKIELTSDTNLSNFNSVVWDKTVSHYKQGDYASANCDLDENEYTILLTPKKDGTVITDANGKVTGVKDRVTSANSWNKLSAILPMDNKKNDVVFSLKNPSTLISDPNGIKSIKLLNQGVVSDTLGSTPEFIYNNNPGHPSPYLYSYTDPVYMFAGKFSVNGFFIKFSQWPDEPNGPGYHDFRNPDSPQSRYFTLINTIHDKLSEFIPDQTPVVIVSSMKTGLRIYKSDGSYYSVPANSNYGPAYFGYGNDQGHGRRGPGSENLIVKNTSEMTLYGMGALRNSFVESFQNTYETIRSMEDIEKEISRFIKYTGVFGDAPNYNDTSEGAPHCFTINNGATSDYSVVDWTKAPNTYIFTGKDEKHNNADVDGLYIPVKKAYEMWAKGGEFMKDEQGNYTKIPDNGIAKAGLYWEDQPGLIKSVALEGMGENAKIKILVNKLKEGNAVVSYRVNDKVYWTWHVWVTDDPRTSGSTYHHDFEKDKNGNLVTDWKWMDRNLGATNANFTGNDWHKSQGLQYQWGRKDPFPSFTSKDGSSYEISGEVGNIRSSGAKYLTGASSVLPVKYRGNLYSQNNTGFDTPSGNIRYSIQNPINIIIPPVYIRKLGEYIDSNGENMLVQTDTNKWYFQKRTTWFSKQKYRNEYNTDNTKLNVAWDLWGDTRAGKYSNWNDSSVGEESVRYAMKSPYDPCPCNWRVPSFYENTGSPNNYNQASPWGRHVGVNDDDSFTSNPSTSSDKFPGIKIYPGLGYDFTGSTRNLGLIPINGNYEYYPNEASLKNGSSVVSGLMLTPEIKYQDGSSDGSLSSSTFSLGANIINGGPWYSARALTYVSDPGNAKRPTNFGTYNINTISHYGSAFETSGVRCIKDPNNAYMPEIFETTFFTENQTGEYSLETLKKWTKEPNSYIEYTNSSLPVKASEKDRVIDIPLSKAYAMQKLHIRKDGSFPTGNRMSASVVWTNNTDLIENVQIVEGTKESSKLRVTLKDMRYGNAVVAFHLGDSPTQWVNGSNQDPIVWSWHVWAPETVIDTLNYRTETLENGGILSVNNAFVKPVISIGVPLETTFMDRDLGALKIFPSNAMGGLGSYSSVVNIPNTGGLHYQWGRKDPLPVMYNPGGNYNFGATNQHSALSRYTISTQNGPITINSSGNAVIPYTTGINNINYTANFTREYADYSSGILAGDSKKDKIKKVLDYSVKNPLFFLYRNAGNSSDVYQNVRDWVSDENGQFTERWGHATEKSPYDPCPDGWRIPDTFGASTYSAEPDLAGDFYTQWSFSNGNNPWYYNGYQNGYQTPGQGKYGIPPSAGAGYQSTYSQTTKAYPGVAAIISTSPATRYGMIFSNSRYNIGNFPNNGIRGLNGGRDLSLMDKQEPGQFKADDGNVQLRFGNSGIWTSSPTDVYTGQAIGMLFNYREVNLTTGNAFNPQAAMSCRCAKVRKSVNGEIGRYEPGALEVSEKTTGKAVNTFAKKQIEEIQKDDKKLTVFPNPVKSILYINANDKEYYYQIYNASGQLVKQGQFVNKQTDLSSLTQGAYLIRINNSETVVKIIKE